MGDPTVVIGVACLLSAAFGFGMVAGRNRARREERVRVALRERYR
jgi:type II secretory pathway pseudopilin PulG